MRLFNVLSLVLVIFTSLVISDTFGAPAEVCEDNSGFCFIMKLGCWFTAVQNVCRKSCNACNQVLKTASNSK
ncbi:unnamed protein product [Lepeophtheirus salmonis]|uniref:(salmon louse) hypothetical protein n=1 Tax=Lepeophtheirus salmonis TaxID=72036 RepID=A0A0K2UIZ1_LEPSM|nr:unnamed protein product [Lepeophtheirus salmonis]CAF2756476.1 unnamed protein product [Lepeophtheirus salmonis]